MDLDTLGLSLGIIGTICWGICFWWMRRISTAQNRLLDKLTEQGKRIERLSREEHDLIKDVHPQVSEIKDQVEEVKDSIEKKNGKRK